jgi:NAD(P)-dependent dehydrogenase (short-subunit alcohol dehydrogenase family)
MQAVPGEDLRPVGAGGFGGRIVGMDLQLAGKRALITGGSRGIGLAAGHALAAEGADVALVARDAGRLSAAREAVAGSAGPGRRVLAVVGDSTDDGSVRAAVAQVAEGLGGVDILVNAAAEPAKPGPRPGLADIADEDLLREIDTKVAGYLRFARAVAPHMVAQGWGRIINISGLAARQAMSAVGSVRNVAVAALTKNLADELGPAGVNVTVIHPGFTVTERTPETLAALAAARGISAPEAAAVLARGVVIGRLVTAAEVADVIAFLASPRSVAITGDAIAAGGGAVGAIHY